MLRDSLVILFCTAIVFSGQACKAADANVPPVKDTGRSVDEKTVSAKPAVSAEEKEAAYTKTLEKRASDILTRLELKDEAKAKAIHDSVIEQYRFLNSWHEANDARLKDLAKNKDDEAAKAEMEKIKAPLKAQHAKFIGTLEANLTSEQIETVKNYIVDRKLPVTYKVYCDMLPQLTEEQKARIYDILKQGREEAMDAGSSSEKTLIFGRYKGKVNIYLSGLGINMKQAEKEWQARIKAQREQGAAATTTGAASEKESPPAAEKK